MMMMFQYYSHTAVRVDEGSTLDTAWRDSVLDDWCLSCLGEHPQHQPFRELVSSRVIAGGPRG